MKISRRHFIPILGTALIGASCISTEMDPTFLDNHLSDKILPPNLKKGDTIGVSAPAVELKI